MTAPTVVRQLDLVRKAWPPADTPAPEVLALSLPAPGQILDSMRSFTYMLVSSISLIRACKGPSRGLKVVSSSGKISSKFRCCCTP